MFGYRGRVFFLEQDFSILSAVDRVWAAGSGAMVGLGAMLALGCGPERRLKRAMEVAGSVCHGVLPPYRLIAQRAGDEVHEGIL